MRNRNGQSGVLVRLAPWVLILALVAFHAVNNWIWLDNNRVIPGQDRQANLSRSLAYYATITPLSWQGLFRASVQDPLHPPLFFASSTPLYWSFATSTDVATMVNVAYWLILLASVYGLGAHLGGRRLGAWATLLAALLPMLYAASRSYYVEFALAALVALTLCLLVAGQGFRRRGITLGFGLVLGLGMLSAKTYPLFVAGPVLLAILHAGVPRSLWHRLQGGLRLSLPDLLVAVGSGLALSSLWYFPNRSQIEDLALGPGLLAGWTVLTASTVYLLLRRPKDSGVNCLSALALGASLASTWYLPRWAALSHLPAARPAAQGGPTPAAGDVLVHYLRYVVNEDLGLVFSTVLALVVVGGAIWLVRRGRWRRLWHADTGWWVLILWPAAASLLPVLSIPGDALALTPVLPALAVMLAAGLVMLPWRPLRHLLLGLTVIWGLGQFAVISFAQFNAPARQTQFSSPLLGDTALFARGKHIELPDAGPTDPRYDVQPDVLAHVEARRRLLGRDSVRLGVLAATPQINAASFVYPIWIRYRNIQVTDLAPYCDGQDGTPWLYGYEYLLLRRGSEPGHEQVQAAIAHLLDRPPRLFSDAYTLETYYPLPGGDEAYLYHLRYWPDPSLADVDIAATSRYLSTAASSGDALILAPPSLLPSLSQQGAVTADVRVLADPSAVSTALLDLTTEYRRLFVLSNGDDGTDGAVEAWLNRRAYRAQDRRFGSLRLVLYGTTVLPPADQPTRMSGVRFGERIELSGTDLPGEEFRSGDVVPLTLFWRARQPVAENLQVFVYLANQEGQVIVRRDGGPVGGQRPTSTWALDEMIVDRHGLLLPGELPAGTYHLVVGLSDPGGSGRLPVSANGNKPLGHSLAVGTIHVVP
jgi:4-amino-4-deoxy-L-arabinose transferase-like glycosyltransferase